MILIAPDVASAAKSSAIWEGCQYASEGLVFLGCVGEYVAEYTKWRTEETRHSLGRQSLIVLILGLGLGLFSLIKTNALAGLIIASLGEQVEQAGAKVERVSASLETALSKSTQAETASSAALGNSTKAQASASDAMTLARGARREADSFEKDIVSAKTQAASAESHLAEAHKEALDAKRALDEYKKPRVIFDAAGLANALSSFKGTEFSFGSVFGDDESLDLLKQIDEVFGRAGWKRVKQSQIRLGIPAIQIFNAKDDLVELGVRSGVRVEVESKETVEALNALPRDKWPEHVRVALLVNDQLLAHVRH
jgi:hypothetical protein